MMIDVLSVLIWLSALVSLYFAVFWILVWTEREAALAEEDRGSRQPSRLPRVTVAIPAWNEERDIAATVESVLRLDYPAELLEIVVVNDGSTDGTQAEIDRVAAANPGRVSCITNLRNLGKAASVNEVLARASGELFACLDADSLIAPEALRRQVAVFETGDARLAVVTPAMKTVAPRTFAQRLQRVEYLTFLFIARLMSHLDCITVAPGPFSVYRTEILRGVGGFAVGNPAEDFEMALRLQERHYRLRQCPDAFVYTTPVPTFRELVHQRRNRWFRGGILNTFRYRHMIGNRAYGDFGLLQMVVNALGFVLAFIALGFFIFFPARSTIVGVRNLFLWGFDIMPFLRNLEFTFRFLDLNIGRVVAFGIMFLIGVVIFVAAHRNARERITAHGWLYLIPYFLYYNVFLSALAVLAVIDVVRGKGWKW